MSNEPNNAAAATPPAASPAPASPAAAPPRKRRWFLRLFVVAVVLLLVLGGLLVAVQWALQNTDYARNIALPIVERKLGLRLHAKGLRVSLLGNTELTDVSVGLPLDKADFLHVPAIKVKHGNLLEIIADLGVPLHNIEIDRPDVDVIQDANGDWNLLQVIDILGKLGGSNNPQPTAASGGVPKLPAVHLLDGTLHVTDAKGHHADVPLNVSGEPQDLLVWKYDLAAGPAGAEVLKVAGVVAPGGDWQHEVTAELGHLDSLAQAFGVPGTYAAAVRATWDGKLTDGKVGGRLTLERVTATAVPSLGNVGVTGAVDVTTGGGAPTPAPGAAAGPAPLVTLTPSNLRVVSDSPTVPELGVVTGAITYDSTGLHARGLKVTALGGAASLDASADPKTSNVDLSAHWTGLKLAAGISQAGSLTASLRQPFPGQPLIRLDVDDRGSIGGTPATAAAKGASSADAGDAAAVTGTHWDVAAQVVGQGTSFGTVDWVLAVPRLNVDRNGKKYDLSGLSAQVQQRPDTIDLLGLTLPPAAGATATTAGTAGAAGTVGGGSRSNTGTPAAASVATSAGATAVGTIAAPSAATAAGNSPLGLSFSSSAHVTLPDKAKARPLSWNANLSASLTADYQSTPVPVALSIVADGDDTRYNLRRFNFSAADATVRADGSYESDHPAPVNLHVALTQTQRLTPDAPIQGTYGGDFQVVGLLFDFDPLNDAASVAASTTATPAATRPSTSPAVAAAVASTTAPATTTAPAADTAGAAPTIATTTGPIAAPTTAPTTVPLTVPTTAPAMPRARRFRPYLTTTGNLQTQQLVVFGRQIGDISIKLEGDVRTVHPPKTDNGPAAADALPAPSQVHAQLRSIDFALFQAPWDLSVDYPNPAGAAELNLSTRGLPLDVLGKAATATSTSPVQGQLASAHWRVTVGGDPGGVRLDSEYRLTDLAAGGLLVPTVDAEVHFADGVATLAPVTARNGAAGGVAHVSATYRLDRPTHVQADVDLDRWAYPLGSALGGTTEGVASSKVDLDVDLARKRAHGSATAAVDVLLHPTVAGRSLPQLLAHAQLSATIRGRTLDLDDVSGKVLNGTFKGAGQVDVDKPLEAAGRVQWQEVDAATLFPLTGNPTLADLGGVFSGTVTVAPSRDPRTLEPVRIDANVSAKGGHFRSVMLGDPAHPLMTHAVAYLNIDRAVLDHSDVYVGGGVVHLWGRVGRNLASQTAIVDFNGLSLDQIAHLVPAQLTGPVPGTVAGSLRVVRNGSSLNGLIGGGHADLVDADLVNVKAIRQLYDILQASAGGLQPVGRGGADFGLEAGTVRVNSFRFYNRGIDAHGLLAVGPVDPSDVLDARVGGQVVGTSRLFKGSRLPLLGDFDQTFSALQSNLSTINVSGTLSAPKVGVATADEIGGQLQQLITGDAQQEASQSGQ